MYATQLVLSFLLALGCAEVVRYDGHKVIRVSAANLDQVKWLAHLQDTSLLDFWTHPSLIRPTDIRVAPDEFEQLVTELGKHSLNYTIIHQDVQKLIESVNQHPHSADKRQLNLIRDTVIGGFPTYASIYKWLVEKRATNGDIMTLHTIGKTYEGRQQYVVKLGIKSTSAKPAIWIDSGIHAREWLSVSTTMNIINGLLNGYEVKVNTVTDLLKTFDFYIMPVANPDGYEYTHTSGDRLWRKTRTRYSNGGIGADPNRNWSYRWCTTGSSRSPASSSYCGPYPWSEKCVYNLKTALTSLKSKMKVYITLHTYGQLWLVPYAYSRSALPTNYNELVSVGKSAVAAMRKSTGAVYKVGRVPDFLYEAAGSSMDWVQDALGTDYTFGMELRPPQGTSNGFIASLSDINPTAQEVWEGVKVVAAKMKAKLAT